MINCIAIDDEPLALSLLADNISKIPFLNLQAACDDGFSANKAMQENDIDLIFVDIQMPGMTGLQFINSLIKKPLVIIVSAYKQYALDGFALNVVDYLTKPVPMDRFMQACNKAKELAELKALKYALSPPALNYTYINAGYTVVKITFDEVLYLEGLRDYVKIYFTGHKKPAIVRLSFKNVEQKWPSHFMRIHKSFFINAQKIEAINKTAVIINEKEIPIGEAYRAAVTALIQSNS
ncbi:LytR/AlgR family response regulator transcription factor [Mucilaginibacter sp. AW1-7]|uniref:LytR/AlgR family response regulator transcription factor n=1 Tax=Mucilaginibacter sp. AW1-7 TaxID=3349874 RepID=UPI003F73306F